MTQIVTLAADNEPQRKPDDVSIANDSWPQAQFDRQSSSSFRGRLRQFLHSHRFHVAVVCLVIFDTILVIVELVADMWHLDHIRHSAVVAAPATSDRVVLPARYGKPLLVTVEAHAAVAAVDVNAVVMQWRRKERTYSADTAVIVARVAHRLSLAVLSLFLVEIAAKLFAFGVADFIRHRMEVFDAVVVIISFSLDLTFHHDAGGSSKDAEHRSSEDVSTASVATGLLIALRLWRVTRVVNGVVLAVQMQAKRQLRREAQLRESLMRELLEQRDYCFSLEEDNRRLRQQLLAADSDAAIGSKTNGQGGYSDIPLAGSLCAAPVEPSGNQSNAVNYEYHNRAYSSGNNNRNDEAV